MPAIWSLHPGSHPQKQCNMCVPPALSWCQTPPRAQGQHLFARKAACWAFACASPLSLQISSPYILCLVVCCGWHSQAGAWEPWSLVRWNFWLHWVQHRIHWEGHSHCINHVAMMHNKAPWWSRIVQLSEQLPETTTSAVNPPETTSL